MGRVDGFGNGISTISFIGDGRNLAAFNVDGSTIPFEISVDVAGVSVLRIHINQPNTTDAAVAFANAMIE